MLNTVWDKYYIFFFQIFNVKGAIHSQLNWAILLCDVIPDGKNWVNCAVLTGSDAGLRTVLSRRISHTENCAVHSDNPTVSSVYLPTPRWHQLKAHPFTAVHSADEHRMIYSSSNTTSYSTCYAFFSDNIMADVASKQQTTALFLSTIVTRTRRHTELTKRTDKPDGKPVLCQRTFSSVFHAVFFNS